MRLGPDGDFDPRTRAYTQANPTNIESFAKQLEEEFTRAPPTNMEEMPNFGEVESLSFTERLRKIRPDHPALAPRSHPSNEIDDEEDRADRARGAPVPDPDDLELRAGRCPGQFLERGQGAVRYERRGSLCEGLYESPVSANFRVVSLLAGPIVYHDAGDTIVIDAPELGSPYHGAAIRVTAVALQAQTYYRMDALLAPAGSLYWPVAPALVPLGLQASDLGIYGHLAGPTGDVYVPLRSRLARHDATAGDSLELLVSTGVDVERIAWSTGEPPGPLERRTELRAAGEPIRIPLRNPAPGLLRVHLMLKPVDDDTWFEQDITIAVPTR